MRYKLTAHAEGAVRLGEPVSVERDGFRFESEVGTYGDLKQVAVSMQVPAERVPNFASSIGPGADGAKATIDIGGDDELFGQLVSQLQNLESGLAFTSNGALRRIQWDRLENEEFIAETDEERKILAVSAISLHPEYPERRIVATPEQIRDLVARMPDFEPLAIVEAFWREGLNFLDGFQYVLAFYYFYFVIEDFYADGKSSTAQVLKAFRRSAEFTQSAERAYNSMMDGGRHESALRKMFLEEGCAVSPEGLHELLVKVRGRLHHYYSRGSKVKGTPFSQAQFESVSLIVMYIATEAIEAQARAVGASS